MKISQILSKTILFSLLIFSFVPAAYPWATGEDYDVDIDCKELPLNGADELVVRITPTDGSFGLPILVGMKDEEDIWSIPFPESEEINVAKFNASCKGNKIILSFQFPAQLAYVIQEYRWDGKNLLRLKRRVKG